MAAAGRVDTMAATVAASLQEFLVHETIEAMKRSPQNDNEDLVYGKLELIGFRVGLAYFESASRSTPRFQSQLEVIKFLCKDVWQAVFHKNIDNLRTNHKGVYVLHDSAFRSFVNMSTGTQYADRIQNLLAFPCGFIRGCLASAGLVADVRAEVQTLPACKFNLDIRTV